MINGDDDALEKDLDGVRDDRVYGIALMYKFVVVGGGLWVMGEWVVDGSVVSGSVWVDGWLAG